MKIVSSREFEKSYAKLRLAEQERFKERIRIFANNPFDPILRNHALTGAYQGCRSIAVGGDLRMVYRVVQNDAVIVLDIGTHAKLYTS